MLRAYRRFRAWTDSLSRGAHAALLAAWVGLSMFAVGALLRSGQVLEQALITAFAMFVLSYLLDPRRFEV